ncbi:hypothetical protein EAF00_006377 [Botryotinia globosa]|nr:hypothetical protein EAF00_006377 [Botryotinia globosa]
MPRPASRELSRTRPSSRNGLVQDFDRSTDGSMGSGNVTDRRKKMHCNPDSGNRSARDHSRESRAPSQAWLTRPKRAESPAPVYLFDRDPYRSFAPESNNFPLYDGEEYFSDSGRKKDESKSRKPIRPPLAPFDGEKYLPGQLSNPQAKAKRRTVEHVNVHAKGEVPILETCSDWEEEPKINRKPIKKREQSQGSISRHAEPELSRHRSGDGKNLKVKSRSEPMRQRPGGEQTRDEERDGAWYNVGGKNNKVRPQIPPANTNRGLADERPPDDGGKILEDWWKGQSHTARTTRLPVTKRKSNPRYYADDNINRSPASDQGRKHHRGTEQHIPPHELFNTLAGRPQEEEQKRKKSPSRLLQRIFKS